MFRRRGFHRPIGMTSLSNLVKLRERDRSIGRFVLP
ncbi:hypothetical protein BDSB_21945 [Burkholderia dolosa PC543]|nr:hypothetical protein BDSB_21945 [Burkholderia dolosa PC543]